MEKRLIRKSKLISKILTSLTGKQIIAVQILPNMSIEHLNSIKRDNFICLKTMQKMRQTVISDLFLAFEKVFYEAEADQDLSFSIFAIP